MGWLLLSVDAVGRKFRREAWGTDRGGSNDAAGYAV